MKCYPLKTYCNNLTEINDKLEYIFGIQNEVKDCGTIEFDGQSTNLSGCYIMVQKIFNDAFDDKYFNSPNCNASLDFTLNYYLLIPNYYNNLIDLFSSGELSRFWVTANNCFSLEIKPKQVGISYYSTNARIKCGQSLQILNNNNELCGIDLNDYFIIEISLDDFKIKATSDYDNKPVPMIEGPLFPLIKMKDSDCRNQFKERYGQNIKAESCNTNNCLVSSECVEFLLNECGDSSDNYYIPYIYLGEIKSLDIKRMKYPTKDDYNILSTFVRQVRACISNTISTAINNSTSPLQGASIVYAHTFDEWNTNLKLIKKSDRYPDISLGSDEDTPLVIFGGILAIIDLLDAIPDPHQYVAVTYGLYQAMTDMFKDINSFGQQYGISCLLSFVDPDYKYKEDSYTICKTDGTYFLDYADCNKPCDQGCICSDGRSVDDFSDFYTIEQGFINGIYESNIYKHSFSNASAEVKPPLANITYNSGGYAGVNNVDLVESSNGVLGFAESSFNEGGSGYNKGYTYTKSETFIPTDIDGISGFTQTRYDVKNSKGETIASVIEETETYYDEELDDYVTDQLEFNVEDSNGKEYPADINDQEIPEGHKIGKIYAGCYTYIAELNCECIFTNDGSCVSHVGAGCDMQLWEYPCDCGLEKDNEITTSLYQHRSYGTVFNDCFIKHEIKGIPVYLRNTVTSDIFKS